MIDAQETQWHASSTHGAVERLTDRVCERIRELPLSDKDRFRLKLAIHEALTNALEHGNGNDESKKIVVTLRHLPHEVDIIVEDEGNGFDPATLPDPTDEANLLKEGGRGIFLVRCYADECRFEDNGRRVVIVKRLP